MKRGYGSRTGDTRSGRSPSKPRSRNGSSSVKRPEIVDQSKRRQQQSGLDAKLARELVERLGAFAAHISGGLQPTKDDPSWKRSSSRASRGRSQGKTFRYVPKGLDQPAIAQGKGKSSVVASYEDGDFMNQSTTDLYSAPTSPRNNQAHSAQNRRRSASKGRTSQVSFLTAPDDGRKGGKTKSQAPEKKVRSHSVAPVAGGAPLSKSAEVPQASNLAKIRNLQDEKIFPPSRDLMMGLHQHGDYRRAWPQTSAPEEVYDFYAEQKALDPHDVADGGERLTRFETTAGTLLVDQSLPIINLDDKLFKLIQEEDTSGCRAALSKKAVELAVDRKYEHAPQPRARGFEHSVLPAIRAQLGAYLNAGYVRLRKAAETIYGRTPLIAVVKPGGKVRLVMDATHVNRFFAPPPLRMPTVVEPFATEPKYFCRIDLKEAFMHLPFTEEFSRWFAFEFEGKEYMWARMGYGWCMAPALFQQVMECVLKWLRRQYPGVHFWIFYDDLLLAASSAEALLCAPSIVEDLVAFGFQINRDKSILKPVQVIEWLGFRLAPEGLQVPLSTRKEIVQMYEVVATRQTWGDLMQFLGRVQWAAVIYRYLQPTISHLQQKVDFKVRSDRSRHGEQIPEDLFATMEPELRMVAKDIRGTDDREGESCYTFLPRVHAQTYLVYTDASKHYLGFSCRGIETQLVAPAMENFEIGYLETLAIKEVMTRCPTGSNLIVRTDSQNAYYTLMRAATLGTQSRDLVQDILWLAYARDISLVVEKISGAQNPADKPSRERLENPSWQGFFGTAKESLTWPVYLRWLNRVNLQPPSTEEQIFVALLCGNKTAAVAMDYLCREILNREYLFHGYNARVNAFALCMYYSLVPRSKEDKKKRGVFRAIEKRLLAIGALTQDVLNQTKGGRAQPASLRKQLIWEPAPFIYDIPSAMSSYGESKKVPMVKGRGVATWGASFKRPQADDVITSIEERKDDDEDDPDNDDVGRGRGREHRHSSTSSRPMSQMVGVEAQIAQLQSENAALAKRVLAINARHDKCEEVIRNLRDEVDLADAGEVAALARAANSERAVEELRAQLHLVDPRHEALVKERDMALRMQIVLEGDLRELKAQLAQMQARRSASAKKEEEEEDDDETYEEIIEELKASLETRTNEVNTLTLDLKSRDLALKQTREEHESALKRAKDARNTEINALIEKRKESELRLKAVQDNAAEADLRAKGAEKRLKEVEEDLQKVERAAASREAELAADVKTQRAIVGETEARYEALRLKAEASLQAERQAKDTLATTNMELGEVRQYFQTLLVRVGHPNLKTSPPKEALQVVLKTLETLQLKEKQLEQVQQQLSGGAEKLSATQDELFEMQRKHLAEKSEYTTREQKLLLEVEALRADLNVARTKLATAEKTLVEERKKVVELEGQLSTTSATLKSQVSQLTSTVETQKEHERLIQQAMTKAQAQQKNAETICESTRAALKNKEGAVTRLEAEVTRLKDEVARQLKEVESLTAQHDEVRKVRMTLEQESVTTAAKLQSTTNDLFAVTKEAEKLRAAQASAQQRIDYQRLAIEDFQNKARENDTRLREGALALAKELNSATFAAKDQALLLAIKQDEARSGQESLEQIRSFTLDVMRAYQRVVEENVRYVQILHNLALQFKLAQLRHGVAHQRAEHLTQALVQMEGEVRAKADECSRDLRGTYSESEVLIVDIYLNQVRQVANTRVRTTLRAIEQGSPSDQELQVRAREGDIIALGYTPLEGNPESQVQLQPENSEALLLAAPAGVMKMALKPVAISDIMAGAPEEEEKSLHPVGQSAWTEAPTEPGSDSEFHAGPISDDPGRGRQEDAMMVTPAKAGRQWKMA